MRLLRRRHQQCVSGCKRVADKERTKATFFDFFDTRELPECVITEEERRVEREISNVYNIAEEFMYNLIPKALYFYLNIEPNDTDEAPKIKKPNEQEEMHEQEEKKKKEEKGSEEGEEDEDKDNENKDEKPARPICLLQ